MDEINDIGWKKYENYLNKNEQMREGEMEEGGTEIENERIRERERNEYYFELFSCKLMSYEVYL